MSLDFANHVALVTGAGSGIGRAIARLLARRGAAVWLVGRTRSTLDETRASMGDDGRAARPHVADVAVASEVRALAAELATTSGSLDILVHAAAVYYRGPLAQAPVEELDEQYRVNLRAPYLVTQACLPLLESRRGQVVFVNSTSGLYGGAEVTQYAATKFGLRGLADSFRSEVNGKGVRVLSVYPGRTATPMQARVHELEGRPFHPERLSQPDDVAEAVAAALAVPRTTEITDLMLRSMQKL
jgi:NAD(P)-dependent dehydrogenase (short-subunit alcohol dehydrogenase family)